MAATMNVFLPLPLTRRGPAYTCGMLAREMAGPDLDITIVTPRARSLAVDPATIAQTLPLWARHVPYRWVKRRVIETFDSEFLAVTDAVNPVQAVYVWPDASLETITKLRDAGVRIFREMINCHRGTAKLILDDAYHRIGVQPSHGITASSVIREQALVEAADHIFCSNAIAEQSITSSGISSRKILAASYGWDPRRFSGNHRLLPPFNGATFVFAGSIGVRKGCHLLLDYWARSKLKGRLVLAGGIEPVIREKFSHFLDRPDVVVLDYVDDIGALYRSADVFVFPSLEEGGPQVTYEACGCGLPVITTPMGAGRIVRQDIEGVVLDPYDAPAWIATFESFAGDADLRMRMGAAAKARASLFCWDVVAERRKQQILSCLADGRCDDDLPGAEAGSESELT